MPVFAVQYVYPERPDEISEVRPRHRTWLRQLAEAGTLLASGPFVLDDGATWPADRRQRGALLLVRATTAEEAAHIMEADPLYQEGLIEDRTVREWLQVVGPWVDPTAQV